MFYETQLGDTWDSIALKVYGSEIHADFLMQNNPKLIGVAIFGAGVDIWTPELPAEESDGFPEWRN